jgi:hypothetical protein
MKFSAEATTNLSISKYAPLVQSKHNGTLRQTVETIVQTSTSSTLVSDAHVSLFVKHFPSTGPNARPQLTDIKTALETASASSRTTHGNRITALNNLGHPAQQIPAAQTQYDALVADTDSLHINQPGVTLLTAITDYLDAAYADPSANSAELGNLQNLHPDSWIFFTEYAQSQVDGFNQTEIYFAVLVQQLAAAWNSTDTSLDQHNNLDTLLTAVKTKAATAADSYKAVPDAVKTILSNIALGQYVTPADIEALSDALKGSSSAMVDVDTAMQAVLAAFVNVRS